MNNIQKTGFGILGGIIIISISLIAIHHLFGFEFPFIPPFLDITIRISLLLLVVVSMGLCHCKSRV